MTLANPPKIPANSIAAKNTPSMIPIAMIFPLTSDKAIRSNFVYARFPVLDAIMTSIMFKTRIAGTLVPAKSANM